MINKNQTLIPIEWYTIIIGTFLVNRSWMSSGISMKSFYYPPWIEDEIPSTNKERYQTVDKNSSTIITLNEAAYSGRYSK